VTTRNPFDSPGKRAVRELWNTPLLRFLHTTYGFRYRYMGLPGVDLLDLKLWRDMLEEVIAFEAPAPPTRNDPQGRRHILALRRNLQVLGIPGHAFFGPMEEVVILRRDYDGTAYQQNKVITLYNLDFCDEIGSRISTREQGEQLWRFEAIRQILRDQRQCFQQYGGPSFFIVMLTVRDQIDAAKLRELLSANLYDDTQAYLDVCGGVGSLPSQGYVLGTHSWALKAFIHNALRQYLTNPHISAVFFPLLRYRGTPVRTRRGGLLESPMLHSLLLCRFDQYQFPSPSFLPTNYLTSIPSVAVGDGGGLTWEPQRGEATAPVGTPSSSNWLQQVVPTFLNGT
jgi:hypothetical protein